MRALFYEMTTVARLVPGFGLLEREFARAERIVLRELRRRLDSVADYPQPTAGSPLSSMNSNGSGPERSEPHMLAESMQRMLRRSMDQSPTDSLRSLFEHVLRELVPDEARILAALADGSTYPLVDVAVAARGSGGRLVLGNASNVGRAAGVAVPALVPTYVTHLLQLGLAGTGPEDPDLADEYQILLTETEVKRAYADAAKAARRAPRVVRRTLLISALGRDFWAACHNSEKVD